MTCPEALAILKQIEMLLSNQGDEYGTQIYDTLCSTIGTARKSIMADDTGYAQGELYSEVTLKVRSMGTNTYIAFGTSAIPAFRFTAINQTYTYVAPMITGSVIPFNPWLIACVGDGATGVMEITGIKIVKVRP